MFKNKIFNLIRILNKKEIHIKDIFLLFLIVMSLSFGIIYTSFAIFSDTIDKSNIASIILEIPTYTITSSSELFNSETKQITVPANESLRFDLTISSTSSGNTKYKVYYEMVSPTSLPDTLSVGVNSFSDNPKTDVIALNSTESKNVDIEILNFGNDSVTLKFDVLGGYPNNEVVLQENKFELIEFSPTTEITKTSNTNEISLKDSTVGNLTDYKIYGNSEQANSGKNILNLTGRTVVTHTWSGNADKRTINGKQVFIGITSNNYFVTPNITSYTINDDNLIVNAKQNGYGIGYDFLCKPYETYTLSISDFTADKFVSVGFYGIDGTFLSNSTILESALTFTTPADCYGFIVNFIPWQGSDYTYTHPQLEKSATATEYEPYVSKPTLDNPSEVLSLGENSKNLFTDESKENYIFPIASKLNCKFESTSNSISAINITGSSSAVINPSKIKVVNGDSFTMSSQYTGSKKRYLVRGLNENGEIVQSGISNVAYNIYYNAFYVDSASDAIFSINSDTVKEIQVGLVFIGVANEKYTYSNIQLEKGKSATEYRPYKYIDLKNKGKNLFSENKITKQLNLSYIEASMPLTLDYYNNHLKGKKFTISCESMPSDMRMSLFILGQRTDIANSYYSSRYGETGANYKTFTISSSVNFSSTKSLAIRFWRSEGANNETYTFSNIQLEEGSIATSYEPYLGNTTTIDLAGHEPLRKVGNVADYIDYKNKKIVRNIAKVLLDENKVYEDYLYGNNLDNTYHCYTKISPIIKPHSSILSNRFIGGDFMVDTTTNSFISTKNTSENSMLYFQLNKEMIDAYEGESVNARITAFFAANPTEVYIIRNEETTEDISLPNIPTFPNTNIFSILKGSLSLTYNKST